jgi:hypothetical protein
MVDHFPRRLMNKALISAVLAVTITGCTPKTKVTQKQDTGMEWCNPTLYGGVSVDGHIFHCVTDSNGPAGDKGHVEEDIRAELVEERQYQHQKALADALTTRVLTDKEMNEVLKMGSSIYISPEQPYSQDDLDHRFVSALMIQTQLRLMKALKAKQQ